MKKIVRLFSFSLAFVLLASLFTLVFAAPEAEAAGGNSRVRVAHLSPDAPAVDIYVNGNKTLTNVPYKTVSDYLTVPSGKYRFEVRPAGAAPKSEPVIDLKANLRAGRDYTVAALGFLKDIYGELYHDDNSAPVFGQAKIRVLHASPDAPAVDVAVKDGPVIFKKLRFADVSHEAEVNAGTYNLEVRVAGTKTVALPLNGVKLEAGLIYTVFAVNPVASLNVVVKTVPGVTNPDKQSRVRVAHLSPDAPAVDIYVNGTKALSNVPFKTVSDYLTVTSGDYNFQVRPAGASPTSKPVIEVHEYLAPRRDYTVAAIGFLAHIEGRVYKDNNRAPDAGNAKVRVIHASPDAPAVDIKVKNGPTLIEWLEFGDAARRQVAAGTYDLEVRLAKGGALALSLPGVKLEAGKVYTVFAVDKAANLGVVVTAVPGK